MDDSKYDLTLKIVIIGESGIGKTNLLTRYTQNHFDDQIKATIGIDFALKEIFISGYMIKAQFWDTAGQEKYCAMARAYYKLSDGVVLVYDVTRRETFEKLKNWIEDLKIHTNRKYQIILIGNKTDLVEARKVSVEEGRKFAQENAMFFWETSAITNADNCVSKAFDSLLEECMKNLIKDYVEENSIGINSVRKNSKTLDTMNANKSKRNFCC